MEAVREITKWDVEYRQPNHIYLLDGDRVKAYIPWGQGAVQWMKGTLKIDRRGRKFEKVDIRLFDVKEQTADYIIEVPGSKGNSYFVNTAEGTCTCPGFTFRGSCKHTKELELEDY